MLNPRSSSETICLASASLAMAPGWGTAATSSVPPLARIWNCSSKLPDDSTSALYCTFELISPSKIFWYACVSAGSPALSRFTLPVFFWTPPLLPPLLLALLSFLSSLPHAAITRMTTSPITSTRSRVCARIGPPVELGLVVDAASGVGVEEVETGGVDHQLDLVALLDPGARVQSRQ